MKTFRLSKYEEHYAEINKVLYQPEVQRTTVVLKTGHTGVAEVTKEDTYNEACGVWCAYGKAMRKFCQAVLEDNKNLKMKLQADALKKYGMDKK